MALPRLKEARTRRKAVTCVVKVKKQAPAKRAAAASRRTNLETEIKTVWGPAFELFEDVLIESNELGSRVARSKEKKHVAVLRAHHGLYARALLAGSEVLTLLRTGHGHGALARWRTLFELTAFAEFLKSKGSDAAQRFLDFYPIETRKYFLARWPALETSGKGVPDETRKVFERLTLERSELQQKYGKRFSDDLGWAGHWFPNKKRLTIHDIVEAADLGRMKSEYKRASSVNGSMRMSGSLRATPPSERKIMTTCLVTRSRKGNHQ